MPVAVLPIRSFRLGKRRLQHTLNDDQRHRLGRALAVHVLSVVVETGLDPLVVTSDPEVAAWTESEGHTALGDSDDGLNGAARVGIARADDQPWVVLHCDLPLLRVSDLLSVVSAIEAGRDVIAPSSDGGTSALSATHPIRFGYGPGSFHSHLARLEDPLIVITTGLLHDVDTPEDLVSAMKHRHGQWLNGIY